MQIRLRINRVISDKQTPVLYVLSFPDLKGWGILDVSRGLGALGKFSSN
jgi:hypothetical protein